MIRCQSQAVAFRTVFSNGTLSGVCDATKDRDDGKQGFRPHELLEAALGSCVTMLLDMYARTHGLPLDGVAVTVTIDGSDPGTTAFVCEIELSGDLLTEAQRGRLLRVARACPVRKTLSKRLVFIEKS